MMCSNTSNKLYTHYLIYLFKTNETNLENTIKTNLITPNLKLCKHFKVRRHCKHNIPQYYNG